LQAGDGLGGKKRNVFRFYNLPSLTDVRHAAQLFGGLPPSLSATHAHELRVPAAGVDNAAMIPGDGFSDANPP